MCFSVPREVHFYVAYSLVSSSCPLIVGTPRFWEYLPVCLLIQLPLIISLVLNRISQAMPFISNSLGPTLSPRAQDTHFQFTSAYFYMDDRMMPQCQHFKKCVYCFSYSPNFQANISPFLLLFPLSFFYF